MIVTVSQQTEPDPVRLPGPPAPVRPVIIASVVIAAAVAASGVPYGLLWALLAPDVPLQVVDGGAVYREPQPEQPLAADGWFVIMAVPFGILAALGVWFAVRQVRGLPALGALTAGTVGAAMVAWWLGRHVGLGGFESALAAAEPGTRLDRPPDLSVVDAGWWPPRVFGVLLVPALAAVATYTLAAAWSRFPTLRPVDLRGAEPD
jgi:hypothetical protein